MKNIQIFSRQTDRTLLSIFGVMVLAAAPMLIVDFYKSRKAELESKRMFEVRAVVEQKVEAYYRETGNYPNSIEVLSFTNSPREIDMQSDLRKIRYRRTPSSFAVGWDGDYGGYFR